MKSVSRFARNTLELLETTRELKELGVVIVFEEQGIDTSQMLGEMQLTMFALAAQEESTSISKNMRWSYQKRMESGNYITNSAPYGYSLNGSNKLLVNPREAEIVKHIFDLYLSGKGKRQIVQILNEENIPPRKGQLWKYSSVKYILTNEKYFGDALMQKKYTTDSLSHHRDRNTGQQQQFYLSGSQQAIISKEAFLQAQKIALTRQSQLSVSHLFTHRILCPDCNRHFRHVAASGKSYWLCPYNANGVSDCATIRLPESQIVTTALHMLSKLYLHQDEVIVPTLSLLHEIEYTQTGSNSKFYELDKSIADLNDKALVLQRLQNKGFITAEEFRAQSDSLAAQRMKLTAERKRKLSGSKAHEMIEKIEELQSTLASWPGVPTEFDIDVFDEVVEKIIPAENGTLRFRLHCGLELKEAMPT